MPYVERVTKAGNTIEIERYFTSRYKKKGISRGDKVKPTKEEQEKVNTRQAERKLRILINAIPQKIYNSISGAITKVATWGTEVKNKAVEGMKNVITGITDVFKNIGSTFAGFGKNMVEGIWNGISGATRWIKDKISGWVGNVTDFLKDLFGIASPSKLMRDEIGVYLAQGIGVGFSNEIGGVKKMIEDSVPQEFDVDAKVNVGNEFKYDNDDKKPKPRGGGSAAGGVVVNQYIYANTTDYAKQQKEAARQFRMIARTV